MRERNENDDTDDSSTALGDAETGIAELRRTSAWGRAARWDAALGVVAPLLFSNINGDAYPRKDTVPSVTTTTSSVFEASHVELGRTSPSNFKMPEACKRDEILCKNEPIIHNISHLVYGLLVTITRITPNQEPFLNSSIVAIH